MSDDQDNIFDETQERQPPRSEVSSVEMCPPEVTPQEDTGSSEHNSMTPTPTEVLLESPPALISLELQKEPPLLAAPTQEKKAEKQLDQRQIPTAVAFLIFGILVGSMFPLSREKNQNTQGTQTTPHETVTLPTQNATPQKQRNVVSHVNTFENITLEAKAAYVWDINTRQALYNKDADKKLPLASLAKVMTAVTVSDHIPKGAVVTVDRNALRTEGDTGLLSGEQWRLRDLLEFTLLVSSNDGAEALANVASSRETEHASTSPSFAQSMNEKAREIGLTQSYFSNPSGLDTSEHESGAYGSARDMARLFEYALKNIPDALEATTYDDVEITSLSGFKHDAKNTNILTNKIPALIASKTGFTNLAGGNLVIAFEAGPGKQIVIAVLGSTYDGRFTDVEKLVSATLHHLENLENSKR